LKHGKFIYLAFVLVATFSAISGAFVWKSIQNRAPAEQPALLVLPEARAIPDFRLTDQDGGVFGPEHFKDQWSLLFFGFTHCPDVCPGTLYDLQQLNERLSDADSATPHQVIFFSVDPERDSPQRLKDYVAYFDPGFRAVTGEHAMLEPLTRSLGIAYRIEPHDEGTEAYAVDHSASILLVNPDGRLHGVFPAPHDVTDMEETLRLLLD
jgi:protein SCO1/2